MKQESALFECEFTETKGRTLRMKSNVKIRDVLFTGSLLHKVNENVQSPLYKEIFRLYHLSNGSTLDYEAMWYWCGLNSLSYPISEYLTTVSKDQARQLKMLHHPSTSTPSDTVRRIGKVIAPFMNRPLTDSDLSEIEKMTIIWTLNCFEHGDSPLCYAIFFLPSFMSHACCPNAMWTTTGVDQFVIRALRDINIGEELTVSYLTEEFGLCPISMRRAYLESTKFFTCDCLRCVSDIDDTREFRPHRIEELPALLDLETRLVALILRYNGPDSELEGVFPSKTDPALFPSREAADELEEMIVRIGPAHWTAMRGWLQLTEYYKSHSEYSKAIYFLRLRIESRRKYFSNLAAPEVSPSLAWALEDLAELILLQDPKSEEIVKLLNESFAILESLFGPHHEYTVPVKQKLDNFRE